MQQQYIERRYASKLCVKLKDNATETFNKLKLAYSDQVLSRTQVFRQHKAFLNDREIVEEEARSGRALQKPKEMLKK